MLTSAERQALPALTARVTAGHPGCRLTQDGRDAVLTIGPDVTETAQRAVVALVAATIADFRLVTASDPEPVQAPEEWLEEHRRGSHHLDHALTTFR